MKRLVALLLGVLLLALPLAACGGNTASQGPVTLVIWHDKEEAVAEALAQHLGALAPDIEVQLEKKNGLTEALKMVGNDASAAPDMYFFAHDKLGVYAEMGILTPVTEWISEEQLAGLIPMTLEAATYKDALYQLPIYFETLLFLYNRELMPDSEVPATTGALYDYMQRTTADGKFGFVEQHSTAYYSAGWIHGFGGEIITADGVPMLDDDKTLAALAYHKDFVDMMPGESEYATVNTLFREGQAASTIGGPWMVPTVRESGIDLGIAPMPVVDSTGLPISPYSGVQGLHVLKVAADNPAKNAAIGTVLEALLDPALGLDMALASGCAPASLACYELDEVKNDDMVQAMRQTAESAVPMPNIPEMDVMWNVTSNLLVEINMRGRSIEEAAADAQAQALDLIAAMK